MANVHTLTANLVARTAVFEKKMKAAAGTLSSFASKAVAIGTKVAKGLAVMGTAAVAAGAAIAAMTVKSMGNIQKIGDLSKQLGTSAEFMSRMGYAAKITGTDVEKFADGWSEMQKKLAEAKEGNEGSIDAFKRIGLSVKDLGGTAEEQMDRIADAFQKLPKSQHVLAADQIFGGSGKELIPLLQKGSAGIRELWKESDRFKRTLSDLDVAKINQLNENWTRLKEVFAGVISRLAVHIAPYLILITDYLIDLGLRAIDAFGAMGDGATQTEQQMSPLLKALDFMQGVLIVIKRIWNMVQRSIITGIGTMLQGLQKVVDVVNKIMETFHKAAWAIKYFTMLREEKSKKAAKKWETGNTFLGDLGTALKKEMRQEEIDELWDSIKNPPKRWSEQVQERLEEARKKWEEKLAKGTSPPLGGPLSGGAQNRATATEFRRAYFDASIAGTQIKTREDRANELLKLIGDEIKKLNDKTAQTNRNIMSLGLE